MGWMAWVAMKRMLDCFDFVEAASSSIELLGALM